MARKKFSLDLIYYLSLIGFFAIFTTTISKSPVLPLYVKSLGAAEAVIGLISAFSPLAGILFSFPVGLLSDRIGRKRLLIVSGFVFLTAPLMYLAVRNPYYLIPIRFFHGIATAILGPIVSAMIVERYSEKKGEMLGFYSSATLIGRTIAPLAGGFIISFFAVLGGSLNFRLVYISAFIFSIPVFIMILFLKEEKSGAKMQKAGFAQFMESFAYFFNERRLFATALIEMATYFAYGILETYLPLYLATKNVPAYEIGLIFSVQILSIALSKPIFGKIADRIDKRMQIIAGMLTIGITMALIPLFSSIFIIILIGIVFGLGLSFSTVATGSYVGDITAKDKLGASMGALSSIMDIGQSSGPFIAGMIIEKTTFFLGFISSLVLAVAVTLFFVFSAYARPSR